MTDTYSKEIKAQVKSAPAQPGCYLYSDKYGNVIYVGKAKNIKKRVASYFTAAATQDERLEELLPRITGIEYRVTVSELDALILEYHLIKQHKPWFNSVMKADKLRPFLRIGHNAPYPTLSVAAERAEDAAEYYDIFTDEDETKAFLGLFGRVWGTAQCGKARFVPTASPCLYYSIGQCRAPCAGKADETQYGEAVQEISSLLQNKRVPKLAKLKQAMAEAADDLEFEQAAQYKAQLEQLRRLQRKARRMYHFPAGANVLVLIRPFRETGITLFAIRDGAVIKHFQVPGKPGLEDLELVASEYNSTSAPVDGGALLAKCLTEISADKAFVPLPARVTGKRLLREIQQFEKNSQGRS